MAAAYLIGTLAAALALPTVGRRIDSLGVRRGMTIIGSAFVLASS